MKYTIEYETSRQENQLCGVWILVRSISLNITSHIPTSSRTLTLAVTKLERDYYRYYRSITSGVQVPLKVYFWNFNLSLKHLNFLIHGLYKLMV